MRSILIRSFALALLGSSLSFAAAAQSKENQISQENQAKEETNSCLPADAGSAKKADRHSKHEKKVEKKMKNDQQKQKEEQEYSLMGIYG